ncbi:MAG: VWA domain-containing protein [Anaerolineae bacterium]
MVDFIRALRAAGVRISLAESMDAMQGVDELGITDRDVFRAAMKTTLVKEARDQNKFEEFFPLFFGAAAPPLQNIPDNLSPEQRDMLQKALEALMGNLGALKDLLRQLIAGQQFSKEQLDQQGQQAGLEQAGDMSQRPWFERRMQRQMSLQQLKQMIDQLIEQLEQMGMGDQELRELREMLEQNAQGLSEQVNQYVGATMAEQMAAREPKPKEDLLDVPFTRLSDSEVDAIRDEIRRLAAKLRSRAALRQKRAKTGTLDPRRTIRANMRYGGVPMDLQYREKHIKPCLVVICDLSTSMRYCAEFLLTLVYELQDQVARTNSYIFISDLVDISMDFKELQPQDAVGKVLTNNPPGHYSTDLGNSMNTFKRDHMSVITSKTTVIVLGDGRNNYNDPRIDIMQEIMRKSRRLIWFNPESQGQWGTGDSDMHLYAGASHGVYRVTNLRELANAVDKILADG